MSKIAFTNVNIFDGSGEDTFLGEVLVEGSNIYVYTAYGRPAPLPESLRERVAVLESRPQVAPHTYPITPWPVSPYDQFKPPPWMPPSK